MKRDTKGWGVNIPTVFYFLGASFMLIIAFTIVLGNFNGMNSKVIFVGSVITTISAALTPLLSINKFQLSSYQIKMWSIVFGLIFGMVTGYSLYISSQWAMDLFVFSSKGLLWIVNISLLLFNLTTLELENSEAKLRNMAEEFNLVQKKLLDSNKLLLEKNKEIIKLQEQHIRNNRSGSDHEIY